MAAEDNKSTEELPRIPDHALVRRIGKGAYGEVWLARSVLGAYRAVKMVCRSSFQDERPLQREFEGIQRFEPVSRTHPGLVSILHVGRPDPAGDFYYVMELADDVDREQQIDADNYVARTLLHDIRQRDRLPPAECIQIGLSLTAALAHLHRLGLVHRDIKPSNIIYINGTPRLADPGLVASVRENPSNAGTLGFMPNEGAGTPGADIFALGRVLYQAVTGRPADQYPALSTGLVEGSDWPRAERLNGVIFRACAADAADRYASADEFHRALAALGVVERSGQERAEPVAGPRRVALLGKPNSAPDDHLIRLLRRRLMGQGVVVFVDERRQAGTDWARAIEDNIRGADAVIVLVSPASVQSEMLAYEVEMAHQAAQRQQGRPRLLPVRLQLAGAWPAVLEQYLGGVQSFSWAGPADDERVSGELIRALETSPKAVVHESRPAIEPAGGAVDLASGYYVVRPTDEAFRAAVGRWDSIVLVKGARQMGKTSLLARGLHEARRAGACVALTDFQKLSVRDFESAESFYLALAGLLGDQLDLDVAPEATWKRERSPNINFERFVRREVLGKIPGQLVWGLDEVDRLFGCPFGSEVFGLFRSWHNGRALDPGAPWARLTLAIAYATEAHLFITDVNQSPFNVGTRLELADFTLAQVVDLNDRHGVPVRSPAELERLHALLGGQPYLVRHALNELASGGVDFETFLAEADHDEGIFGDHLRRMLVTLAKDPPLMEVVRNLLQGRAWLDHAAFYRLRSGGLLRGDSLEEARPRCEIYASYLRRHLA